MRKHYYLPKKDAALTPWLNNFSSKLKNKYASVFGISSADADKIVGFAAFFSFLEDYLEKLNTFSKGLTSYKNNFRDAALPAPLGAVPQFSISPPPGIPSTAGMLKVVRNMVTTIKAHAAYSLGAGEDLGIEGAQPQFHADQYKPKGKAKTQPGLVEIGFTKKGVEAMNVYVSAAADTGDEWIFLATKTQSPCHDSRASAHPGKPEKRRYRMRGVIADKEIGVWSDVIEVVFAG